MSLPAKIVVVDDQHLVRRTLRALLIEQPNWQVYDVESGILALALIKEVEPHVIVVDIVMPGMNGIELAYEIRKMENSPKIILTSSHYTPEEAAVLARLFGDGNFIPKSEAGTALVPAVSRLLPEECQAGAATA